jgi:hypothetical protein
VLGIIAATPRAKLALQLCGERPPQVCGRRVLYSGGPIVLAGGDQDVGLVWRGCVCEGAGVVDGIGWGQVREGGARAGGRRAFGEDLEGGFRGGCEEAG